MKKYKTYKIEFTPTEKFPEMVTITKGKTINKKFITEEKAIVWIESSAAIKLIERGKKSVVNELDSIGLSYEESIVNYDESYI
jgi:hypothetical protein